MVDCAEKLVADVAASRPQTGVRDASCPTQTTEGEALPPRSRPVTVGFTVS